ncbi:MAG TPA: ribonuclease Y [Solirubrobacteraceae bacterium]|jgi:ribonuclease Y|nr:ribonuclease Y [Solirubrobacteraceae bacterium]
MNILIIVVGLLVGAVGLYTLRVARQMSQTGPGPAPAAEGPPEEDPVVAAVLDLDAAPAPEALSQEPAERRRTLEDVAGLSSSQAKRLLMKEVEDEARHEIAKRMRELEQEARREADRRARSILAVAMQRLAGPYAAETTVTVVPLASDDLKGRIIGREGRNIRALEHLTGVDFIIDDTPGAVVLSSFDGVRREVARLTLERLLVDGRVHPARIEETYNAARADLERTLVLAGEEAMLDAGVHGLDPELVGLLGRLKFRTSYSQNVLAHSVECAHLAALMADELGASAATARRAALLHDIGKAVTHEVEGPHALVGADIARRRGESEAVAHAMEAHHNEVEPRTVEAVLVQAADALSGGRPGARGESLEAYIKRLRELEVIAGRHPGVERVYAMQAGREIRVMVEPGKIDDDAASLLAREIAREVERELEYPGQIKVTVIREARSVTYAR